MALALPEMLTAPQIELDSEAAGHIKGQACVKADAKAKVQVAADAPAPTEAPAGGALVAAETESMQSKAADDDDAKAADDANSLCAASISGSMLAQICERAFLEHQLAARHFTFYSFCAPVPCVYVMCVCARAPWYCPNHPDCVTESDRATVLRRGVLRPVEHYHRHHVHLGVHRRRL